MLWATTSFGAVRYVAVSARCFPRSRAVTSYVVAGMPRLTGRAW